MEPRLYFTEEVTLMPQTIIIKKAFVDSFYNYKEEWHAVKTKWTYDRMHMKWRSKFLYHEVSLFFKTDGDIPIEFGLCFLSY